MIDRLVSPEQTAYIKGRYIGENIRLLLDIIEYTQKRNKSGVLLFLDFRKAFDSLDWNFIQKCLIKLGFKNDFCKWVQVIYTDPEAFVKVNGFLSKSVKIKKGIRQGCPLSALLFILCTDMLARKLDSSEEVEGISFIHDNVTTEVKCTQYADDTCIFLRDIAHVLPCIDEVKLFSSVSGLYLNLSKTEGLCIGTLRGTNPNIRLLSGQKISWYIHRK